MVYRTNIPTTSLIKFNSNHNLVKNKFGFQEKSYSCTHQRDDRSLILSAKILQAIINQKQGMHPRTFCRRWFGLSAINDNGKPRFTEEQILAMEAEYGYREQCINLISTILKVKPNTIHRWGKGVRFDKITAEKLYKYEVYLGYVDAIRILTTELSGLDQTTLIKLLQQFEITVA